MSTRSTPSAHEDADTVREAIKRIEKYFDLAEMDWKGDDKAFLEDVRLVSAAAARAHTLDEVTRWFHDKPWQGIPDGDAFGCRPYSENERALGYGTYRDPRFLPAALAANDEGVQT